MSTGIVTRRKSAMHIDNSYGIDVVAANTNLVSKRVLKGEPFSTQIVCDAGYSIYEITIKMGGVDITSTAYDATYNMISIASVTGDVDIECYAMHTLPSDYIRVDGIKNPSNAYINTGYKLSKINIVKVDFTKAQGYVITSKPSGIPTANGTVVQVRPNGNAMYDVDATGLINVPTTSDRNTYLIDHYNGHVYFNNELKRTYNKPTALESFAIWLFKCPNTADGTNSPGMIIHFFSIFDATTHVYERYYIPCLNDSGVAGFWDAARGVFQGSSNSTAFQPVYVQDNLIAHYDGIDNAGVGAHDASATTWKDLKGSNDAELTITEGTTMSWESDGWVANNGGTRFKTDNTITNAINNHDFTMEYVIRPTGITPQSGQYSLSTNRSSTGISSYFSVLQKRNITLHITNVGVSTPNNSIGSGIIYHVATRKKGTSYSIFINGELVASITSSATCTINTDGQYWIGGDASASYKGKFYVHRVYTKALTDEEIKGNYNIDKLRFNF